MRRRMQQATSSKTSACRQEHACIEGESRSYSSMATSSAPPPAPWSAPARGRVPRGGKAGGWEGRTAATAGRVERWHRVGMTTAENAYPICRVGDHPSGRGPHLSGGARPQRANVPSHPPSGRASLARGLGRRGSTQRERPSGGRRPTGCRARAPDYHPEVRQSTPPRTRLARLPTGRLRDACRRHPCLPPTTVCVSSQSASGRATRSGPGAARAAPGRKPTP